MSGVVTFICQDDECAFDSRSIDLAERHEHRTGHDVWEVWSDE